MILVCGTAERESRRAPQATASRLRVKLDFNHSRRKHPLDAWAQRKFEHLRRKHAAIRTVEEALKSARGDAEIKQILDGLKELVKQFEANANRAARDRAILEHFEVCSNMFVRIQELHRQGLRAHSIDRKLHFAAWLGANGSSLEARKLIERVAGRRFGLFKEIVFEVIASFGDVTITKSQIKRLVLARRR